MLSWMRLKITQIRVITWTTPQPGTTLRKTLHNLQRIGWTSRVDRLEAPAHPAEEAHPVVDHLEAAAEEAHPVADRLEEAHPVVDHLEAAAEEAHPVVDHLEAAAKKAQASQLVLAMPLLGRQGMAGAPPMRLDSQTMDIVNLTQAQEEKKQMKSALAAEIAWIHPAAVVPAGHPAEEVPAVAGRPAEEAHLAADHLEVPAKEAHLVADHLEVPAKEAHLAVDPLEALAAFRHRLLN